MSAHTGARHQSIVKSMQPLSGVIIWQPCNDACKQPCSNAYNRVKHYGGMHDRTPANRHNHIPALTISTASAPERPSHSHSRRPAPEAPSHSHGARRPDPPATARPQAPSARKSRFCNQLMYIESKNPTTKALFGEFSLVDIWTRTVLFFIF